MSSREIEPSEQGPRSLPTDDSPSTEEVENNTSSPVHRDEDGTPLGVRVSVSPAQITALGIEDCNRVTLVVRDGAPVIEPVD